MTSPAADIDVLKTILFHAKFSRTIHKTCSLGQSISTYKACLVIDHTANE